MMTNQSITMSFFCNFTTNQKPPTCNTWLAKNFTKKVSLRERSKSGLVFEKHADTDLEKIEITGNSELKLATFFPR
jgi:hypothetical protein